MPWKFIVYHCNLIVSICCNSEECACKDKHFLWALSLHGLWLLFVSLLTNFTLNGYAEVGQHETQRNVSRVSGHWAYSVLIKKFILRLKHTDIMFCEPVLDLEI